MTISCSPKLYNQHVPKHVAMSHKFYEILYYSVLCGGKIVFQWRSYLFQQVSLSTDTEAALSNISHIGDIVKEDHQSLVSHVCN